MEPIRISLGIDTAAAAESVKEFLRDTTTTLNGGIITSVEKAQRAFDELGRKIKMIGEVMQQNASKSATASQAEQDAIKKVNQARELEILRIQEKRAKLGEMISLSTAGSDQEKAAIKAATDDRIEEINVMKDQIKAQSGINTSVNEGAGALDNYFNKFLGLGGIIASLDLVKQSFEGQREEMERIVAAANKIHSINLGQFNNFKAFYSEFGLTKGAEQDAANIALTNAQRKANVTTEVMSESSTPFAPILKERGIKDLNSPAAQSFLINAAILHQQGYDPDQVANFAHSAVGPLTGEDMNAAMSALGAAAGSPKYANQLMEAYFNRNSEKLKAAGFHLEDVAKMTQYLHRNGEAPPEIQQDVGRAIQAYDRLLDLSPEEEMALKKKLHGTGLSGLIPRRGTNRTIPRFVAALKNLPPLERGRAIRAFSGPRGDVAANAMYGFQDEVFPPSTPYEPMDNVALSGEVKSQLSDATFSQHNQTPASEVGAGEDVKNEKDRLENKPEQLPWYKLGYAGPIAGKIFTLGQTPNLDQIATANLFGKKTIHLARILEAMNSGQIKSTPAERAKVQASLNKIGAMMNDTSWHSMGGGWGGLEMDVLTTGSTPASYGKSTKQLTRAQVLSGITDEEQFLSDHLSYFDLPTNVNDIRKAGPILDEAKDLESKYPLKSSQKPATQPTSQPVSMNIHNRNVFYGYGYDQIGAPESNPNRYG